MPHSDSILPLAAGVYGNVLSVMHPQRDDGEQGEESRGGAQDGVVGPLTLGLDAEMGADLLKRVGDILPINITPPK